MSYTGEPGTPGKTGTDREAILQKIKNRSVSSHYDFVGERVESILLRHLLEEENQECCKGME